MKFVVPYAKNRGRCQMLLGRTLRAADNLMQLCIHGGSIKYGDFKDAMGGSQKAKNPMQVDPEGEEEEEEEEAAGQGGGGEEELAEDENSVSGQTRQWCRLAAQGWANAAAISVGSVQQSI